MILGLVSKLVEFTAAAATAIKRTVEDRLRETVSLKDFGAVGDGVVDDTAAILKAKAYAIANAPMNVRVPKGIYKYTDIGNWGYSGIGLVGESHRATVFRCTTSAPALLVDAFAPGLTGNDATAPFAAGMNIRNITFEGTSASTDIIRVRGMARSVWSSVFARVGEPTAGIAFHFQATMLNTFLNIGCSTDLDKGMVSVPYEGLRVEAGSRNSVSQGNSSNNSFLNPYFEGLKVGIRLAGADNNTFMSGSAESSSLYDVLVAPLCRYNTFVGMGFESTAAAAVNISDAGEYSQYINCYANKKVYLQGRGLKISGGYYQRIEAQAGSSCCTIADVNLKHWESSFPGTGGFSDSGFATAWRNLWDDVAQAYTYAQPDRFGVPVNASPSTYTNTTGRYVEIVAQTGTLTQVRKLRGTDSWLCPTTVPAAYLLAPGDKIEFSYSVAPGVSGVPLNGLQ